MHVLGSERGPYAIHRTGVIRGVLGTVLEHVVRVGPGAVDIQPIARAITAMRLLDLQLDTVAARLSAGQAPGPEAAQAKRMLADTEQQFMAAAHGLLGMDGIAWAGEPSPWIRSPAARPSMVGAPRSSETSSASGYWGCPDDHRVAAGRTLARLLVLRFRAGR